jgi:threonine synthase
LLEAQLNLKMVKESLDKYEWDNVQFSVWKYKHLLPIDTARIITLGEGGTRLHPCSRLGKKLGVQLWVKNEGENPTGSFKDRGMTVGVTKAINSGAKTLICASTGNTAASLAAYSAKAGVKCVVMIPSGKIALGKLSQSLIYGAKVIQLKGNFDEALKLVFQLAENNPSVYLLNSVNPFRIEGQKTLSYEVSQQLNYQPVDYMLVPVGNAGNISAIWKGLKEFNALGFLKSMPRLIGVQAEGASPIADAIANNRDFIQPVAKPETVASAIRIGSPVSWKKAIMAIRESKGTGMTVSDEEILEAQKLLGREEGIFVEPASASSIAGLIKKVNEGAIEKGSKVVCITTGNGLKDPDIALRLTSEALEAPADISEIQRLLQMPYPVAH